MEASPGSLKQSANGLCSLQLPEGFSNGIRWYHSSVSIELRDSWQVEDETDCDNERQQSAVVFQTFFSKHQLQTCSYHLIGVMLQ